MPVKLIKIVGKRAAHKAVSHHVKPGGRFDVKFGISMLRDGRVPILTKLLALGLGAAFTGLLVAFEVPLEALLGVFLPFLGFGLDFIVDGLEAILMPFIFASLLLPFLANSQLVEWLRSERYGLPVRR